MKRILCSDFFLTDMLEGMLPMYRSSHTQHKAGAKPSDAIAAKALSRKEDDSVNGASSVEDLNSQGMGRPEDQGKGKQPHQFWLLLRHQL